MTLYTYIDSSEELAALVVERLVEDTIRGLRWPRSWRGVLRLFAKELDALVLAHPAMVEAYERGMVRSGRAEQVAKDVLGRLMADGLSPQQARDAYVAVHAVVLGYALMRSGREHATAVPAVQDAGSSRAHHVTESSESLASVQLAHLVDKLLDGVAP